MAALRSLSTVLLAAAALLVTGRASAAEERRPAGEGDAPEARDPGANDGTSEKRELPDYDGRPETTTPGDVLLWGPRVALAPLYLVSEFVIRRPLGWAIAGAERAGLPAALYDFFAFGPDHQAGFFPTAYADFGFRPSVGLYTFWNDAGVRGHELRLRGSTGGKEWASVGFTERFRFGPDDATHFQLDLAALRRPDFTFFGLGPDSRQSNLLRYGRARLEARAALEQRPSAAARVQVGATVRSTTFRRGGLGNDPRLADAIVRGMPAPAGYVSGYTLLENRLAFSIDQRRLRPAPRAGAFAEADFANAAELRSRSRFVTYGGTVGGFVDLNGGGRVVALSATTRFADGLAGGEIPFTELVTLGGQEPMRGYFPGRLADRSAAVAELSYRWPVWIWLDGTARAEVGNVFGEHLAGFRTERLRWSGTLGVESTSSGDGGLEILVGAGSETFESGGKVDSVRFVIGSTHGL